ncbi:Positive regulator of purine utilization [Paramyrothecium foliicola]|nr:Positive regulator of purine utilization [Paramyrothecium foliicola]
MADTQGGGSGGARTRRAQQGRRNPRLRLACLRCQRRKIRCDGELPACKHCRNAGVQCADGESARLKDLPRAYITTLKERVEWLESIIHSRCPDVDLSQGPLPDENEQSDSVPQDETDGGQDSSLQLDATHSPITITGATPQQPRGSVRPGTGPAAYGTNPLSHEIGLVSLATNQDPRYIGPSSGYFLARVMLTRSLQHDWDSSKADRETAFPSELVEAIQGPAVLPSRSMSSQLCNAYFDFIHAQYPALHQPTFMSFLEQVYANDDDPVAGFQVYMVMAIGATVLSGRLKARIPGESFCLAAMRYFHRVNIENSLQGLQCLILLLIFTIHNPAVRLNVWYLNYQCIAALIDLGLQRDLTAHSGISTLEQELRTRIFWVIFTLDRTIATMMGRPVGFRDEACELRLPQGRDDHVLSGQASMGSTSNLMAFPVHLFKLAKLNSEIKYVANSVVREAPKYAYPTIIDIFDWQKGVLQQLKDWAAEIPADDGTLATAHVKLVCQMRYHSVRMLLLRPSPAIPKPSAEALIHCYDSAKASIGVFSELYKKNFLVHSWLTFHSLVLSLLTMLYCIKASPDIARQCEVETLMNDLSVGLSMLSATGEHWSGAKRSRDILDDLGRSTIRWLRDASTGRQQADGNEAGRSLSTGPARLAGINETISIAPADQAGMPYMPSVSGSFENQIALGLAQPYDDGLFAFGPLTDYADINNSDDLDLIVRDLFQGLIPDYPAM